MALLTDAEIGDEAKGWIEKNFSLTDAKKAFQNGWNATINHEHLPDSITNKNYDDLNHNGGMAIAYRNDAGERVLFLDRFEVINTTRQEALSWDNFFREDNKLNISETCLV